MSTASAWSTPEMNTLRPLRIHESPSRRAVVVIWCEFDPASGSVMPNAIFADPSARRGSQLCFCSSVPNLAMIVPQIAGETTMSSRPAPAAANLLLHQRELVDPRAPAAVLLRQIHPEETEFACLVPQFGQRLAAAGLGQHVVAVAVLLREFRNRRAQLLLLLSFDDAHSILLWILRVDHYQHCADLDLTADLDVQLGDHPVGGGGDRVFHLHRLQPQQRVTRGDPLTQLRRDANHGARHRRQQRPGRRPGRPGRRSAACGSA